MNHFIALQQGIEMTKRYRENREAVLDPKFQNQNVLPLSETFDRAAIDALLAQPGCTKLRVYYSMDENRLIHVILVAADAENRDMLPVLAATGAAATASDGPPDDPGNDGDGLLVEAGVRCPPECPPSSDLNP